MNISRFTVLAVLLVLLVVGPALAQEGAGQPYTVQAGDTLAGLADKYLGDYTRWSEIVAATQAKHTQDPTFAALDNPNRIEIGWKLWIPQVITPTTTITTTTTKTTPAAAGSPTGTIAFSFYNPAANRKVYEIDLIKPDGTGRYVFPLDNTSEPALSPDGTRIAFRSWGTYRGARCLAVSRIDGSEFQCVTRFFEDANPEWGSDGQTILFATTREGDRRWRMRTVRPDLPSAESERDESDKLETALSRADRQNLYGEDPSWSPDDQRIVYRGCDPSGNSCGMWVMTVDGQTVFPIVTDENASDPEWSPNSERIAFRDLYNNQWDIWTINADGTRPTRLTNDPAVDAMPTWSPDGQWIAFASNQGGNWGIYIMRSDGSDRRLVFAYDGGSYDPPAEDDEDEDEQGYGPRSWADEQLSWSASTF